MWLTTLFRVSGNSNLVTDPTDGLHVKRPYREFRKLFVFEGNVAIHMSIQKC